LDPVSSVQRDPSLSIAQILTFFLTVILVRLQAMRALLFSVHPGTDELLQVFTPVPIPSFFRNENKCIEIPDVISGVYLFCCSFSEQISR